MCPKRLIQSRACRPSAQAGFTVVELLVVLALLAITVVAVVDIFSTVSRSLKQLYANQQVQADLRFAAESMVREIHVGSLDYAYYQSQGILLEVGGVVQPLTILALLDSTNQPVRFRQDPATQLLQVMRGSGGTWQPLTSDYVKAVSLRFYLVPASDPFVPCGTGGCGTVPNEQPRVTFSLTAQSQAPGQPLSAVYFQTTVETRSYRR